MNQIQCPGCAQGRTGVLIEFPDGKTRTDAERALPSQLGNEWLRLDEVTIWLSLRLVYDSLEYWIEFHAPEVWTLHHAVLTSAGRVQRQGNVTLDHLLASKRGLWVDEIVREKRVRMMMQPIVNVQSRRVIGYEFLARGISKEDTVISPADLYQAAREQNQLFLLDKTCRICGIETAAQLPSDSLIFINFIPTSIYVPEHCLATTIAAVEQSGIERNRVVFEVVETDRVEDIEHLKRILGYYRQQGFRTALDDVGAGFNNVSMLEVLQPDIVKLDREWVREIHHSADKQRIAKRIWEAGRSVGATMLAEGIEEPDESRCLFDIGYRWQQGYWFGRPKWEPQQVSQQQFDELN